MPGTVRVLVLVLAGAILWAGVSTSAWSQTQAANSQQEDIINFATEYTEAIMTGVVGGGLLMNVLTGGSITTLAGAMVGSAIASWFFIDRQAHNYVIQRAKPMR